MILSSQALGSFITEMRKKLGFRLREIPLVKRSLEVIFTQPGYKSLAPPHSAKPKSIRPCLPDLCEPHEISRINIGRRKWTVKHCSSVSPSARTSSSRHSSSTSPRATPTSSPRSATRRGQSQGSPSASQGCVQLNISASNRA